MNPELVLPQPHEGDHSERRRRDDLAHDPRPQTIAVESGDESSFRSSGALVSLSVIRLLGRALPAQSRRTK